MATKKYVLWIEDDATYNLQYIAAPVVMSPSYDLTLAGTISEAIHFIQRRRYDVVIFDLRMPPGRIESWIKVDQRLARSQEPPRLGLHMLLNMYKQPDRKYTVALPVIEKPLIHEIGILSVDPWEDVESYLRGVRFQYKNYQQKRAGMPSNVLLKLVEQIAPNSTIS